MKKISRRMLALVFVALMVVSLIPAKPVSAASMYYPKKVTTFESRGTSNSINISNLPKGVRLKSVKTSNSDVINITNIGYDTFEDNGKTIRNAFIQYEAKTTGKANITFKVKNSKKTVKVTVKPYTNPVKSVNVFGAKVNNSTNLKNLTKNWRNAFVDLDGTQKTKTIKVVAAKGWKVASISIWPSSNDYPDFNKWSGGGYKGTRTLKTKLPGEGSYWVNVDMYNPKLETVINVQYFVYY